MRFLSKSNRGSITLEAAIVLPLYMFALVMLISIIGMLKTYEAVEVNVYQAGKELALYTVAESITDSMSDSEMADIANTFLVDTYTKNLLINHLQQEEDSLAYIESGSSGISLWNSRVSGAEDEESIIDIIASYKLNPKIDFFGVGSVNVANRARLHAWTGYEVLESSGDAEERIVYITESGTVYHLTPTCTHINLSITPVNYEAVGSYRNENGSTYGRCLLCGGGTEGTVFITSDGDCFHSSVTCSGLKRTVIEIPISEVGTRPCCQRCVSRIN